MHASTPNDPHTTRDTVREGYAAIARAGSWNDAQSQRGAAAESACCAPGGGCCGVSTISADDLAQRIGYDAGELAAIPAEANMGLSCGNPGAIAALRTGETVLDLGCGGGFDAFLCGPKVGATGRVIGVDMTPDMLAKARRGLEHYRRTSGLDNVEFRLGEIEHLPVADASVDVVISNCVINLSPDKARVWREVGRVLKPGGRVAVSDLVLLRPLPEAVAARIDALIGCIAGAALADDLRAMMDGAGLSDITLTPKPGYVEALAGSGDPLYHDIVALLPAGATAGDFITSMDIAARKPA